MEKLSDKVTGLNGMTVQEVLEESVKELHNAKHVVVITIMNDGGAVLRRTRMDMADLAVATQVLQANCTHKLLQGYDQ